MFFSAKSKGFFVDQNDHSTLVARTSSLTGSLVVEALKECPAGDDAALAEALKSLQPKKTPSGYLHAVCGVYTPKRVVRRATLEPKRVKEAGYLNDLAATQFRIETDKHALAVLSAVDGSDYDATKGMQKEVIFAGMLLDEINTVQDQLLGRGIYPERLELGSLATLGALADYATFSKARAPTLVLEMAPDSTHSYIVGPSGLEATRPIPQGLDSMIPVVQKELGLRDEESAKKLFYSNTFDFTGMGPLLMKRLLKELQSSIGFYEVQTGQSIGQIVCTAIPPKLAWLEATIATQLGVAVLKPELLSWLQSRQITFSDAVTSTGLDARWLGLFGLMAHYTVPHAALSEKAQ